MKLLLILSGFLNGGFMLADGIYVLLKGKYIGPEKPGPWAQLFYAVNVDVFKLGPLFIIYGCLWMGWLLGLWTPQSWAYTYGLAISVLTLWYIPVGAAFSLVILAVLFFARNKTGL